MKKLIRKIIAKENNPLAFLISEGFSKIISFLAVPYFVNLLDKDAFGELSLYWISVPIFSIFVDLSTRSYIKKIYFDDNVKIKNVLTAHNYLSIITLLILVLFYGFFNILLGWTIVSKTIDLYILVNAFLYAVIENYMSFLQIKGNSNKYSVVFALRNGSPYIITAIIFSSSWIDIKVFPIVQAAVYGLIFIWVIYKGFAIISVKTIYKLIVKGLKFSLPILPSMISSISLIYIDRFLIKYYYSTQEVAEYTVAYVIASLVPMVFNATGKWWQTFLFKELKENNKFKILKIFKLYALIIIALAVFIVVFRTQFVLLMSNKEYLKVADIIPVLIIGMIFQFLYTSSINVPFYYGKTSLFIIPSISAFVINLVLNIILIPIIGYKAAALTTAIAYFVEFGIIYIINISRFGINLFSFKYR